MPNEFNLDFSRLSPEEQQLLVDLLFARERDALEASLLKFFYAAWKVLEPASPLIESWHYELLCEWLTLVATGEFKRKYPAKSGLIINVPPRTAKSTLVNVCFPVWCWILQPALRFFSCSYSQELSEAHSVRRRDLITSNWFQERWGNRFTLRKDRNRLDLFSNDKTGDMLASSVGGSLTGKGGGIGILDDPLKGEEAHSEAKRLAANNWLEDTFFRRFDDPSKAVSILVMQRLHEDDPTGHLLGESEAASEVRQEKSSRWIHLNIPLVCEEDTEIEFPISGKKFTRKAGDVLQPARFTPEYVSTLQKTSRIFAGQYQQRPAPAGGIIFNPSWWQYYDGDGIPEHAITPSLFIQAISVDAAFKAADSNDYVSITVWGFTGPRSYLLDRRNEHLGYVATKEAIRQMLRKWPKVSVLVIEDKANGTAVAEELRRENLGVSLVVVNPLGGKVSRAEAASVDVEAGNVFLPRNAPWVADYIGQHGVFPNGKHDDDVDSTSQIINWRRGRSHGLLELWSQRMEQEKNPIKEAPKAAEQEARKVTAPKALGKVVTSRQTPECPKCQNKILARYAEGQWACGACGAAGQDK